jgi:nitrite reductase/ring-hydroxylating ferredoxin subunit
MKIRTEIWICDKDQLTEGSYILCEVLYADEPSSVVVFRHKGNCLAYRNLCVHMPRRLDCEKDTIFDDTQEHLRCSMHGITYDPVTGESMSEICKGKKLTPVKVQEKEDGVWINDKRVKPLIEPQQ